MYVHIHTDIHTNVRTYVHTYIHLHTKINIHNMYIYIYIYACMYIHTSTHTLRQRGGGCLRSEALLASKSLGPGNEHKKDKPETRATVPELPLDNMK